MGAIKDGRDHGFRYPTTTTTPDILMWGHSIVTNMAMKYLP